MGCPIWTGIQTDMTKLIVTLRNFVNPTESYCLLFCNIKRNLNFCLKIQFVQRSKHNLGYKNRSIGCTEMFVACSVVNNTHVYTLWKERRIL